MTASQTPIRVIRKLGPSVGGLAVGGTTGTVVGSVVGPAAEMVAVRERKGALNIGLLVRTLSELTGVSAEGLEAWARESTGRLQLVTSAMQAAYGTIIDEKVRGLSRVLATVLEDDAQLEYGQLVVDALADLDAAHVRVLHAIVHDSAPGARYRSHLQAHLPDLARGVEPVAAVLERTGMITAALAADPDDPAWMSTPFGVDCLEFLEAGVDERRNVARSWEDHSTE
jgi:hypothetical protein